MTLIHSEFDGIPGTISWDSGGFRPTTLRRGRTAGNVVDLALELLLDPLSHESLHLCSVGNLLFGLALPLEGVLGQMATNARLDGLQGAGTSVPAIGSGILIDIVVLVRILNHKLAQMYRGVCGGSGQGVCQR